jgi:hypothetical protein
MYGPVLSDRPFVYQAALKQSGMNTPGHGLRDTVRGVSIFLTQPDTDNRWLVFD